MNYGRTPSRRRLEYSLDLEKEGEGTSMFLQGIESSIVHDIHHAEGRHRLPALHTLLTGWETFEIPVIGASDGRMIDSKKGPLSYSGRNEYPT